MNNVNASNAATDEIMLTSDVLARYKISRSTLYFWSTPARMPASFKRPFPPPKIAGSPKRWRKTDLLQWEEEVNAVSVAGQQPSQDVQATQSATGADLPDSREGYSEP
ncbi:hypothetical protein EAH77_08875 [Ewingella americana]|uniref:AlpA family phage regulatory protein n=1 Tax=Ewingella americana TaxID=41202 RepID=A0A502GL93_9GAMM|nr:hypothetical protein EAH77_08875 [Ewingella americana]